jgi:hypothetical protein
MSVKYLWSAAVTLVVGCSSTPVDVGSYLPDTDVTWDWTDEQSCAAGPQLSIVGTWIGSKDVPQSPSRSTPVRLVISRANGKRVCGTLTVGPEATPWPAATDANAAYPPDLANTLYSSFGSYLARLEGLPQTITGARVGLPRLTFRASYAQWKDWCAMQTPYLCEDIATEDYYCIPVSGSGGLVPRVMQTPDGGCVTVHSGESHVVDCGKVALCLGGPCTCNAAQCTAPPLWGGSYELDFRGDTAVGSGMYLTRTR